jgi:hypothetical protein
MVPIAPSNQRSPTLLAVSAAVVAGLALSLILTPPFSAILWPVLGAAVLGVHAGERRRWKKDNQRLVEALLQVQSEGESLQERQERGFHDRLEPLETQLNQERERLRELELVRHRFGDAVEFAALSLENSEAFAREQVQDVISGFRDLGSVSQEIEAGVAKTFQKLLDPQTPRTLGALVLDSKAIDGELKEFFSHLGRLQEKSQGYMKANADELSRISQMAVTIEEFFENIRMISLNLSIEASRNGTGTTGKALQVLAQRLREFSNRAQEISAQQKAVVEEAQRAEVHSEADLKGGFTAIMERIPPLQGKLDSFPSVVEASHSQFDGVSHDVSGLSETIRTLLEKKIGTLQFQDLTRQENLHLVALLSELSRSKQAARPSGLDDHVLQAERLALARFFNERTTTSNERKVLLLWLDKHGLSRDHVSVRGSEREAGSIELF